MDMTEDAKPTQTCTNCQGGIKQLRSATLMTWLGNDLITVPDFPTWICDMCGHRSYDSQALAELSILLNPEAGTPIQPKIQPTENKPPLNPPPMA
jgi:YgiT-type zinc finger domain-containing protein